VVQRHVELSAAPVCERQVRQGLDVAAGVVRSLDRDQGDLVGGDPVVVVAADEEVPPQ
jgi:hypothetical protein